jgi:hypothetical protein
VVKVKELNIYTCAEELSLHASRHVGSISDIEYRYNSTCAGRGIGRGSHGCTRSETSQMRRLSASVMKYVRGLKI